MTDPTLQAQYNALLAKYDGLLLSDADHQNKAQWALLEEDAWNFYDRYVTTVATASSFSHHEEGRLQKNEYWENIQRTANELKAVKGIRRGQEFSAAAGFSLKLYVPFGDWDPVWIVALAVGAKNAFKDRSYHPPPPSLRPSYALRKLNPSDPTPLRIAIVGDLGTNDSVHRGVLKGIKSKNPDYVIHLGDIYVCGTTTECTEFWKVYTDVFNDEATRPQLWAVPGNHEYISAGEGYYNFLLDKLGDTKNKYKQETSFFCLESAPLGLQLIGLDTGYKSTNFTLPPGDEKMDYTTFLSDEEAMWFKSKLNEAKTKNLRTIVLMHHQLISSFWKHELLSKKLLEQTAGQDDGNNIISWIWGHEHKVVAFEGSVTVRNGNPEREITIRNAHCVGHGACPAIDKSYDIPNIYKPKKGYLPGLSKVAGSQVYNNGFVILQGDSNKKLTLEYYEVHRDSGAVQSCGETLAY